MTLFLNNANLHSQVVCRAVGTVGINSVDSLYYVHAAFYLAKYSILAVEEGSASNSSVGLSLLLAESHRIGLADVLSLFH